MKRRKSLAESPLRFESGGAPADPFADADLTFAPMAGCRKGILVRVDPKVRKALRQLALDQDKSLQVLMTEAINDLLKRHEPQRRG